MQKTGFENLRVYQLSEELADLAWSVVVNWNWLPQQTLGKQFVNSADSIGANIAEGTGRGSYADNKRFAKIARGSLQVDSSKARDLLGWTPVVTMDEALMSHAKAQSTQR